MIIIGVAFAVVAMLALALCALADPVLLSRMSDEDVEGGSGRSIVARFERVAPLAVVRAGIRGERLVA